MRVLVTGSREFAARSVIHAALNTINETPGPHTLVHGAARGADTTAARHAATLGWTVEAHPANWQKPCAPACRHRAGRGAAANSPGFCPSADGIRNQHMVNLGADIALAFYATAAKNGGTQDCVTRAEKAGIPVHPFTDQPARQDHT